MPSNNPKQLGQFFTPRPFARFMTSFISPMSNTAPILEPCCGEGVFIEELLKLDYRNVLGYEIDDNIEIRTPNYVECCSFLSVPIKPQYELIIGNPPYVRFRHLPAEAKQELQESKLWNEFFNSLCDYLYIFILQAVEMLKDGGQLIFVTPSYWLSTTHSEPLRNYLIERGGFETICMLYETPVFKKVASSIMVFKYVKGRQFEKIRISEYDSNKLTLTEPSDTYDIPQFAKDRRWTVAKLEIQSLLSDYEDRCTTTLGKICDIGNGMVTGLDKAFQIPNGVTLNTKEKRAILAVIKGKHLNRFQHRHITPYIFLPDDLTEKQFRADYPTFDALLEPYRDRLSKRYQYGRKIEYWEWVFLRNHNLFSSDRSRIFVPGKERISHKSFFRFAYIEPNIYPTQDVTGIVPKKNCRMDIYFILAILNSKEVFNWVKYNGIVKGRVVEFSEKPLSIIPIREANAEESQDIVSLCRKCCHDNTDGRIHLLQDAVNNFLVAR